MKIFDCFTFFNELELLELRLEALYDFVDCFVIVESNKTHRNENKDYNFELHKDKYARFHDKIKYIKLDEYMPYKGEDDWSLENHQRNYIMTGLIDALPSDLIMISDIDEIPNPRIVKRLKENEDLYVKYTGHKKFLSRHFKKVKLKLMAKRFLANPYAFYMRKLTDLLKTGPVVLEQELFYYYMNCRSKGKWYGTEMVLYKNLKEPQKVRNVRDYLPRVEDGGWHFSYMGGVERIIKKMHSTVEPDEKMAKKEWLEKCMDEGVDLYGRSGADEFEYEFLNIEDVGCPKIVDFCKKYPQFIKEI